MLVIRSRPKRSRAAVTPEPLEAALGVPDRPGHPGRAARRKSRPTSRRKRGWVARMSEPSGWMRLPRATSAGRQRGDEQRQLVRRRGHVGVGEDDADRPRRPASRPGRPSPCRRAARVSSREGSGSRVAPAPRAGSAANSARPGPAPRCRRCCRRRRPARSTVSGQSALRRRAQVGEELVQGGPEPGLLVERGQNDREARNHVRECTGHRHAPLVRPRRVPAISPERRQLAVQP